MSRRFYDKTRAVVKKKLFSRDISGGYSGKRISFLKLILFIDNFLISRFQKNTRRISSLLELETLKMEIIVCNGAGYEVFQAREAQQILFVL